MLFLDTEGAEGGLVPSEGNTRRDEPPPIGLVAEVGVDGDAALAPLSERLRYSVTFSWKEALGDDMLVVVILLRSSADRDQPFRDMFRRSPNPPPLRLTGLEGASLPPWDTVDKSRTDLVRKR